MVRTLRTLNSYKELMRDLVGEHRGRVVGSPGDNVLAEFASVVDAVEGAVEIQQVLRAKNALLPETRKMDFRIGINLGDVIEEEDSIYGDGVNVAARLEGLAEAGGICISGSAYEQIENKIPLRYDYLGKHEVKNITRPVKVYRARIEPEADSSRAPEEKKPGGLRIRLSRAVPAGIALMVIVGAAAFYQFVLRPSAQRMEAAANRPDRPAMAVLPFVNMSGGKEQESFSDGITEDIITGLSKETRLSVTARNSTFTYKGKPVKVKQVSEELKVQYVLEGSVQKSGDRVQITAQLIDARTGNHLWAERYESKRKDLFALKDEITLKILMALQMKLLVGEYFTVLGEKYFRGKRGLASYMKTVEGINFLQLFSVEGNIKARRLFEEAVALSPENPVGYCLLGWVYLADIHLGSTKSPWESFEKALALAQKARAMDDSGHPPHALLSQLNPYGVPILYLGYGSALRDKGRFEEAVSAYKRVIQLAPVSRFLVYAHANLAAVHIMMGREKEARDEAAEVFRISPKFSLDSLAKTVPFNYKDQSQEDKIINAFRKAGLN
jgi:adenylate cyclase